MTRKIIASYFSAATKSQKLHTVETKKLFYRKFLPNVLFLCCSVPMTSKKLITKKHVLAIIMMTNIEYTVLCIFHVMTCHTKSRNCGTRIFSILLCHIYCYYLVPRCFGNGTYSV